MSIKHSIVKFKFEDFAGLTQERGTSVKSQIITDCQGNSWMLCMYPRGYTDSISSDDLVSMSLYNQGSKDITARATFVVRDASGKAYKDIPANRLNIYKGGGNGWGVDVITRSDILNKEKNILVDGALHVDVHIQIQPAALVVPTNPLAKKHVETA